MDMDFEELKTKQKIAAKALGYTPYMWVLSAGL